jgi:hypothetical protein
VRTLLPSTFYEDNPRKFWVVDVTCEGHGRSMITRDIRTIQTLMPYKGCKFSQAEERDALVRPSMMANVK